MEKEIAQGEKKIRVQSQNDSGVFQSGGKAVPEDMAIEKAIPHMPVEWSVGHIPYKRAMVSPNKTAIIYEDISITYKELTKGSTGLPIFW